MVEKIIIKPGKVRGLGNIISPAKTTSDFSTYKSSLVLSSGGVYTLAYAEEYSVALSLSSSTIYVDGNTTLTATVTYQGSLVTEGTVTFYDGTTSLGTGSLGSGGTATYTASGLSAGTHQLTAVFESSSSAGVTLTVNKYTSTITLSASSSGITYGSSVTLSGTLSVGTGKSVKIYRGSTLIDTVTTTTDGAFSKTVTGLSVGSYNFKAVYEGDSTYTDATSLNVFVTVTKATPTVTLSVPSTGTVGTAFTITGTVSVEGLVKIIEGNTVIDQMTTGSSFSKSITKNTAGTYGYSIHFDPSDSDNYNSVNSSSSSIVVSSVAPASMTLEKTAGKQILSYADKTTGSGNTEYCTLTATVLDSSSNPLSGQSVVFKVGSTTVDTVTTDSNGTASYSYVSAGSGDVTITAECSLLTKSFAITDAWKHISSGSYTGTSAISFQQIYESSAYDNIEISATIKAPNKGFSLSFLKSKDSSSSIQDNIFTIGVDGANNLAVTRVENGNTITYTSDLHMQYTANSDLNCVIRIENGVVTLKLNNLSYTSTPITGLKYIGVRNWNNAKTVTYTDFIVKPL